MKSWLLRAAAFIDRLNVWAAWFAAGCCALLAAILLAEIASTSLFNYSQPYAVEYSAYLTAITLFGGTGYALRQGAHIRVALLLHYLPKRLAAALDFSCTLFALCVAGFLAYGLIELATRSYSLNSVSYFAMKTPLFIPQAGLALSISLLALALAARALRILTGAAPETPPANELGQGAAE